MGQRALLLPHRYQVIGWWIIIFWLIWCSSLVLANLFHVPNISTDKVLVILKLWAFSFLPTVGTLLICLSKEKIEDEYIAYIRSRSVFIMVVLYFCTLLINCSLTNIGVLLWRWHADGGFMMFSFIYTNPFILTVLYLALFKGSLFVNKLKTRNDG